MEDSRIASSVEFTMGLFAAKYSYFELIRLIGSTEVIAIGKLVLSS